MSNLSLKKTLNNIGPNKNIEALQRVFLLMNCKNVLFYFFVFYVKESCLLALMN